MIRSEEGSGLTISKLAPCIAPPLMLIRSTIDCTKRIPPIASRTTFRFSPIKIINSCASFFASTRRTRA